MKSRGSNDWISINSLRLDSIGWPKTNAKKILITTGYTLAIGLSGTPGSSYSSSPTSNKGFTYIFNIRISNIPV